MESYISQLRIRNFRCFDDYTLTCSPTVNIIVGDNGSGKTSLFESIYYGCFVRSFRTKQSRDMIMFDRQALHGTFIGTSSDEAWKIDTGLSHEKRKVTVNNKRASSYKDLIGHYQTLYIASDDNTLIIGEPEKRRAFFDRTIVLHDASYADILRRYNRVLKQRNALLQKPCTQSAYDIWTHELWALSVTIQEKRQNIMKKILQKTVLILKEYFHLDAPVDFVYEYRGYTHGKTYQEFCDNNTSLAAKERIRKHSCFGAHRDDIIVSWHNKKTKLFASRGQQKLVVLAMKLAQAQCLSTKPIFLIDDFITDFDTKKLKQAAQALSDQQSQLFIAVPFFHETFKSIFNRQDVATSELKKF